MKFGNMNNGGDYITGLDIGTSKIVAIVADSPREAYEAIAKVRIDYEPLPMVFDVEDALKPGAPVVWPEAPDNIVGAMSYGDAAKVDEAFAKAAHEDNALFPVGDAACTAS